MFPKFLLFLYSLLLIPLFISCKNEVKNEASLLVENDSQKVRMDYHGNYLKEISYIKTRKDSASTEGMVQVEGGTYLMGGSEQSPHKNELPRHKESISTIWVDQTEVTNAQFKQFVEATGYVTTAERSFEIQGKKYEPGALVFDPSNPEWWWKFVKNANWKNPSGPGSSIEGKEDHPVVQVSWYDAMAYAKWAGKRLPTEAEFEYLNRGGKENEEYNWGNDFHIAPMRSNFFQGKFPKQNSLEDKFEKTAPVESFPANGYGLFEISGNVWEWCLDTYHPDAYYQLSRRKSGYFEEFRSTKQEKVIRGGSFLCSENYCSGYRNSARMSSAPDNSLEHTGFRCVKDI